MVSVGKPVWGLLQLVCVLKARSSTAGPATSLSQERVLSEA